VAVAKASPEGCKAPKSPYDRSSVARQIIWLHHRKNNMAFVVQDCKLADPVEQLRAAHLSITVMPAQNRHPCSLLESSLNNSY
jgi:hypothetical protein